MQGIRDRIIALIQIELRIEKFEFNVHGNGYSTVCIFNDCLCNNQTNKKNDINQKASNFI